ncbi:MAG: TetR/AcrR family transcriptional regulator [Anaerolineaceae bacterium]|nr:TetR/AcrR family transcriptional regulator [Anaerolineaceae bacterium]
MDNTTNISTEQKIIQSTIKCIELYGMNNATNRRIAAMAEVNIAAINYYFRSKQNLLDQVMEISLDNAFDWEDLNKLPSETPLQWCIEIFVYLSLEACNYPGLTRAHLYETIVNGDYESPGSQRMMAFMKQLAQELTEHGIEKEHSEVEQAIAQIGAAFITAVMIPHFFEGSFNIDLTNETHIRKYYTSLVTKLLG